MQKTNGRLNLGITLRASTVERLDELRGDLPRSRAIEKIVCERLGLPGDPL